MLRHGSSLSAVRERRIEYELSYDRPTGAGAALPTVKNTLGFGVPRKVARLCGERRRNEVGGFWDILSQSSIAEFVPTIPKAGFGESPQQAFLQPAEMQK